MKFMFIVQGEGRGHLTQAITLYKMLERNGHKVVGVLVGKSKRRELPTFFYNNIQAPVFRFDSPNFLPAAHHKRNNIWSSIAYNLLKTPVYLRSIFYLHRKIKELQPDKIINFYDLMAGLTYLFFPPKTPCISVAHQYLFLHPDYSFPKENIAELKSLQLFNYLTSFRSKKLLALSIEQKPNVPALRMIILPPLLRDRILNCRITQGDYLHGYLLNDNYADEITNYCAQHPEIKMHFFWDKKDAPAETHIDNLTFHTLDDRSFIHYMSGCKAYATTAGFESVCEAMYLGKPVLMVPTHIEQTCNAHEAALAGAGIVADRFDLDALLQYIPEYQGNEQFKNWVQQAEKRWMAALN